MSSRKKNKSKLKKKPNSIRKWGLIIVAFLIIALVSLFVISFFNNQKSTVKQATIAVKNNTSNKTIRSCRRSPSFPLKFGLKPPYAIDLRQNSENKGLKMIEIKTGKTMKLPEWESFGYLGLYTLDNKGNIFTSPLPYVSIDINPPKDQNKLLVVDSRTGTMSEFMNLPFKNTPSPKNPFGIIGLDFDCDTKSLYAASLSGSTFNDEGGRLFQIDPDSKKILNTYENLDVLGIGVFQGNTGKRLYLGLARKPEIYSIGLDEKGGFKDDLKFEFSLLDIPGGGYHKALRIVLKDDIMILKTREFSYTLIAASNSLRTIYTFKYNKSNNKWDFIELHNESNFI